MNRLLYVFLVAAITIVGFTMYQHKDLGQVSIRFAGSSFETNLVVLGAALLSAVFIILIFILA